ncbi:MAG: hypothetical protein H0T51_22905 [Pirellulales bacterium]|nr:hypothetical protein [Pirellulales bacterium]
MRRRNIPQRIRRGAALYVAVTGTAMIVSVLALSSMAIVRIERRQAVAVNSGLVARANARSAVELALLRINSTPAWRTTYSNNVETAAKPLGAASDGTVSWKLRDSDGDLDNSDAVLTLKGIGRVGTTVQVSSVEIRAGETPGMMRNYELTNDAGGSEDDLQNNKWWGQYFKSSIPANANGWRITSAQIRARRNNTSRIFRVRLYAAGGGNIPNGTMIESVDVNSNSVPTTLSWVTIPFAGTTPLDASQAVNLAIETTASQSPIKISYRDGSVSAPNSALLRGDPDWETFETDKALQYRVNGAYTTSDDVAPVAGTWDWDVP